MRARQRERKTESVLRRQDQMRVIGHEAIGPAGDAKTAARLGQPVAIERIIVGFEEYFLTPVATLGDVMRQTGNDDAGDADHDKSWHRLSSW